ncbi:MAG: transcription factor WhiB [Pseudonocardiales bacterium]|nr:transcription factor WhiB [Pseudonocardiales bacterium]
MNEVKLPAVSIDDWQWHAKAACRGMGSDPFFYSDNERGRNRRLREQAAKAVCRTCPVIAECLDWAVSVSEPYGIWGGQSPDERRGSSPSELRHVVGE